MPVCTVTERAMTNLRKRAAEVYLTSAKLPEFVELVLAPGYRITYRLAEVNDEHTYKLFRAPSGINAPPRISPTKMRLAMLELAEGKPLANAFS